MPESISAPAGSTNSNVLSASRVRGGLDAFLIANSAIPCSCVAVGLEAIDLDGLRHSVEFLCRVIHRDGGGGRARHQRAALRKVADSAVGHAHHVWHALVGRGGHAELALRVGLGRADLLHALR